MIEKLRSHLKSDKGFTLIELLVVIAIIAILVVIVVVAINPVQRIKDANDRSSSANVRSVGTLISTCVTDKLSKGVGGAGSATGVYSTDAANGCANTTVLGTYGTVPGGLTIKKDDTATNYTVVCAYAANAAGSGTVSFNTTTGAVTAAGSGVTTCP